MHSEGIVNPLGMTVERRPALMLSSLMDSELISYAETYHATQLERELTKRLCLALDKHDITPDGYCQVCGNPV